MGIRNLTSGFAAAVAAGHVQPFPMIELGFSSGTQYLCGLDFAVTWSGNTYLPALGLLNIEPVQETGDSFQGLRIEISGVQSSQLASALSEPMQGRPVTLRLGAVDATNTLQVDSNVWSGLLDAPEIEDGPTAAKITLIAEHRMATWDRPRVRRYTDAQLQASFPGDLGLQYIAQMEQARIVWPTAEFFKKK